MFFQYWICDLQFLTYCFYICITFMRLCGWFFTLKIIVSWFNWFFFKFLNTKEELSLQEIIKCCIYIYIQLYLVSCLEERRVFLVHILFMMKRMIFINSFFCSMCILNFSEVIGLTTFAFKKINLYSIKSIDINLLFIL